MNSPNQVYSDQWQACAELMRSKAKEFDELAKNAPIRPKETDRIMRALVHAESLIDLAKGSNFPDVFVLDMARVMRELVDLLR